MRRILVQSLLCDMALGHKWIIRLPPNHTAAPNTHTQAHTCIKAFSQTVGVELQWQVPIVTALTRTLVMCTGNSKRKVPLRAKFLHWAETHKQIGWLKNMKDKILWADASLTGWILFILLNRNDVNSDHSLWQPSHFLTASKPLVLPFPFSLLPLGQLISFIQLSSLAQILLFFPFSPLRSKVKRLCSWPGSFFFWFIYFTYYFFLSPKHKQENHLCDVIKTFTVAFHCKLLNSFPGCKQGHILQNPWMSTEKKLEQSLGKPALRNVDTFHSWWLVLLNAPFSPFTCFAFFFIF